MTEPERVLVSWSGGKDSTLALAALLEDPAIEVVGLLTSVTRGYDRVSIHGVRRQLLEAQAESLRLPLTEIALEPECSNAAYETAFLAAIADAKRVADTGLAPRFPLWGVPTPVLAERCWLLAVHARLVCVDTTQLAARFVGRLFDRALLSELPPAVDPCGERGEFHTFVADGPGFREPVPYDVGEIVRRGEGERFVYCDLTPRCRSIRDSKP
jgi:diphthamide synthase (EF-2-diphthine--ammonia ligase)